MIFSILMYHWTNIPLIIISVLVLAFFLGLSGVANAQEEEGSTRSRVSPEIDRQAKHLFDKAVELIRSYERPADTAKSDDMPGTVLENGPTWMLTARCG